MHQDGFELYALEAIIKGVLAGYRVAIVTDCLMKVITTCSLLIGQSFPIIIVELTDIDWLQWPIKKCCGTVLATIRGKLFVLWQEII